MRYTTRFYNYTSRIARRHRIANDKGLYGVASLIRRESRESIRFRPGASRPLSPPHAHIRRGGLKEINFHVERNRAIIGPRKFKNSRFFNRPVPNIHEKGGVAVGNSLRRRVVARYPERSFMWSATQRLHRKGKIMRRYTTQYQGVF